MNMKKFIIQTITGQAKNIDIKESILVNYFPLSDVCVSFFLLSVYYCK